MILENTILKVVIYDDNNHISSIPHPNPSPAPIVASEILNLKNHLFFAVPLSNTGMQTNSNSKKFELFIFDYFNMGAGES